MCWTPNVSSPPIQINRIRCAPPKYREKVLVLHVYLRSLRLRCLLAEYRHYRQHAPAGAGQVCCRQSLVPFDFYAPNFDKVGDILVSACPCVCMGHRDIVLKLHVWIPHGKIAGEYFLFSLNYPPLLDYGPLTNKWMTFCKCHISKSIIARNLKLVSADRE